MELPGYSGPDVPLLRRQSLVDTAAILLFLAVALATTVAEVAFEVTRPYSAQLRRLMPPSSGSRAWYRAAVVLRLLFACTVFGAFLACSSSSSRQAAPQSDAGGGASGSGGVGGAGGGAAVAGSGGSAGADAGSDGDASTPPGCAPVQGQPLLLHTTLDKLPDITVPASGSGAGTTTIPSANFEPGKCGDAIRVDSDGQYIQFPEKGNFDLSRGSIDFWYRPDLSQLDGKLHGFFVSPGFESGANGMVVRKVGDGLGNQFQVSFRDKQGGVRTTSVAASEYSFTALTWVRITVTWDFSLSGQAVRIYFDGAEPKYQSSVNGTPEVTSHDMGQIAIGAASVSGGPTGPAGGLLDDFKIYGAVVPP